jgi:hypothetical protein
MTLKLVVLSLIPIHSTSHFDFVLFNSCGNITASDRTTFALAARLSVTANMGI